MADPKRVDYARARRLATERRRRDRRRLRTGRAPIGRPRYISVFARLMGDLAPAFAHFAAAVAGADKAVGDSMRALAAANTAGRMALVDGEVSRDSVTVDQAAPWPFPEGTDL